MSVELLTPILYNYIMLENRKNPRFQASAHARIRGVLEGENILKDLSITGCCLECTVITDLQSNVPYQIEIEPEKASQIGKFELTVERRWIHSGDYSSEIGFFVTASPRGKQFQRYVDYLAYRNSH